MIVPPARILLKNAFESYATKAPIPQSGKQMEADEHARWFWEKLTGKEREELTVARLRMLDSPKDQRRRLDFDAACKRIRTRLFKKGGIER